MRWPTTFWRTLANKPERVAERCLSLSIADLLPSSISVGERGRISDIAISSCYCFVGSDAAVVPGTAQLMSCCTPTDNMNRPCCLALVISVLGVASASYHSFKPGQLWLDTDGNRIRAHSAGLLEHAGVFYWYGADSYIQADGSNRQINLYTSIDLYNWNNTGAAFVFDCALVNATKCYVDRPKVLFNERTSMFVMWMKSTPWTAVATAASPEGPFRFNSRFFPNGEHNGDVTAFVDPVSPADAYWLYSIKPDQEKRVIRVSKMSPDWTALTGYSNISSTIAEPDEAPAAFYSVEQKMYYVWTSHCSGWKPNAAMLHTSSSLSGLWRDAGNPTHNTSSHDSQSTFILPLTRADGSATYIYIADRFEPYISGPESGRYVWLPLSVAADGTVRVEWHNEWTLGDL